MSYIEKMYFVNWRFRSFVQYIKLAIYYCHLQVHAKLHKNLFILYAHYTET